MKLIETGMRPQSTALPDIRRDEINQGCQKHQSHKAGAGAYISEAATIVSEELSHKRAVQSFSCRSSSLRIQPHSRPAARSRDNMETSYSPRPCLLHGIARLQNVREE